VIESQVYARPSKNLSISEGVDLIENKKRYPG